MVETHVDGVCESRAHCSAGDYIVAGSRGGRYPMAAAAFEARYEPAERGRTPVTPSWSRGPILTRHVISRRATSRPSAAARQLRPRGEGE